MGPDLLGMTTWATDFTPWVGVEWRKGVYNLSGIQPLQHGAAENQKEWKPVSLE